MNKVISYSIEDYKKARPEGTLGNLITDIIFKKAKKIDADVDFCILNNGGLRSPIYKGKLTTGNVYEIMPFDNTIVTLTITHTDLLKLFDYLINVGGEPISNMFVFTTNNVLDSVLINNKKITKRNYRVATSDYLANGGDKMDFFLNPISYNNTGLLIRDVLIEHFSNTDTIKSKIDGRFKF